jgi:FixJ family two-component response regulator
MLDMDIDLLICDVRLGNDNGIDFTKRCQANGFDGAVLIISGFIPNVEAFEASWHFLRKPFNRQSLLNEVEALVLPKN